MKEIYNKIYSDYKKEFNPNAQQNQLRCFAFYLWSKKELEILKKYILADAYNQVCKESFENLSAESSLMKAMQGSFRGSEDYPSDINLKLSGNEKTKIERLQGFYKVMYLDAFVAAE